MSEVVDTRITYALRNLGFIFRSARLKRQASMGAQGKGGKVKNACNYRLRILYLDV